jgi:hypothetical protein
VGPGPGPGLDWTGEVLRLRNIIYQVKIRKDWGFVNLFYNFCLLNIVMS